MILSLFVRTVMFFVINVLDLNPMIVFPAVPWLYQLSLKMVCINVKSFAIAKGILLEAFAKVVNKSFAMIVSPMMYVLIAMMDIFIRQWIQIISAFNRNNSPINVTHLIIVRNVDKLHQRNQTCYAQNVSNIIYKHHTVVYCLIPFVIMTIYAINVVCKG